jgi:hypothetical protein
MRPHAPQSCRACVRVRVPCLCVCMFARVYSTAFPLRRLSQYPPSFPLFVYILMCVCVCLCVYHSLSLFSGWTLLHIPPAFVCGVRSSHHTCFSSSVVVVLVLPIFVCGLFSPGGALLLSHWSLPLLLFVCECIFPHSEGRTYIYLVHD